MKTMLIGMLSVTALLAGCSGEKSGSAADETKTAAQSNQAESQPAEPEPSSADAPEAETKRTASTFPAGFHGHWIPVASTCSEVYADDHISISSGVIGYYESEAKPTKMTISHSAKVIDAMLAFEGEGEQWDEHYQLYLTDADERLKIRIITGDRDETREYKRCKA